jgi:ectoine hydroxylase-related dioxygenase (phytanoyl-CoA dioxygenase family)
MKTTSPCGAVRHFDFTWMRAVAPGRATAPHGDVVFMGRGTHDLYTAWVPLGDVDYTLGGLMVLESSNNVATIRDEYARRDVDEYCENQPEDREQALAGKWTWNGALSDNPAQLREQLGGRWLTSTFRAGDLLTFSAYTIHGSIDNRADRIRLSSDSRYQLASAPIDERWIGEAPIGHGPGGKRGLIC